MGLSVCRLSRAEFDELPTYCCSFPSAQTIGKRWKSNRTGRGTPAQIDPQDGSWWIAEYAKSDRPGYVDIKWSKAVVD